MLFVKDKNGYKSNIKMGGDQLKDIAGGGVAAVCQ
jgi:hypothetical protein